MKITINIFNKNQSVPKKKKSDFVFTFPIIELNVIEKKNNNEKDRAGSSFPAAFSTRSSLTSEETNSPVINYEGFI